MFYICVKRASRNCFATVNLSLQRMDRPTKNLWAVVEKNKLQFFVGASSTHPKCDDSTPNVRGDRYGSFFVGTFQGDVANIDFYKGRTVFCAPP